jgi:hypothetical protein
VFALDKEAGRATLPSAIINNVIAGRFIGDTPIDTTL